MNNKRILKNIGITMLMKPFSMILSFLYTPLVLAFLGQEKYGIWAIVLNVITWINYFDIGIGNGLRNKLAESFTKNEKEQAQKFVSTAYLGAFIIATAFCTLTTVIWNLLDLSTVFNLNLLDENTNVVIFISVLFVCINFVLSISKTSAYAIQQPGIISVVGVFVQIIQICAVFVVSHIMGMTSNLMAMALIYGIVSLFDSIIVYYLVTRNKKFLKPNVKSIDLEYMKPLLTLGMGFFALQICSLILNTTDNLLISNLYGSSEVTPYSIVYKVFYIAVQVHAIIIMPMWSAYTEAATRKDIVWIKNTMRKINLLTLFISSGIIALIFLFEPFAELWLGTRLDYGSTLIFIVAIYMIGQMFGNNYSAFLCGVGVIKIPALVSGVCAVLNIPLSIFFAVGCGMRLSGVIMGSFLVVIIGLSISPVLSYRWIHEKEKEWI